MRCKDTVQTSLSDFDVSDSSEQTKEPLAHVAKKGNLSNRMKRPKGT